MERKYKLKPRKVINPYGQSFEDLDNDDIPSTRRISGDALEGHGSIDSWEKANGRGFWGNSTTGYHYDKDVNN